jgi:hypothetical protein
MSSQIKGWVIIICLQNVYQAGYNHSKRDIAKQEGKWNNV